MAHAGEPEAGAEAIGVTTPTTIPGFDTASPTVQAILERLEGVRSIGPGRWVATCPCCDEDGGLEIAEPGLRPAAPKEAQ